jgi:hypothetical protein
MFRDDDRSLARCETETQVHTDLGKPVHLDLPRERTP